MLGILLLWRSGVVSARAMSSYWYACSSGGQGATTRFGEIDRHHKIGFPHSQLSTQAKVKVEGTPHVGLACALLESRELLHAHRSPSCRWIWCAAGPSRRFDFLGVSGRTPPACRNVPGNGQRAVRSRFLAKERGVIKLPLQQRQVAIRGKRPEFPSGL